MAKDLPLTKKLGVSALILVGLLVVGCIIAVIYASEGSSTANTAVIKITGPIMASNGDGWLSDGVTTSSSVVKRLEEARDDPLITGVILEINSPGGSAVASDEIAVAVRDVRAAGKPVVSWIREVGASGAYWVASSSDHIVANRMSITGSIGVIGSYLEFSQFLEEWNMTYNRLVAGQQKDIGDPFQELSVQDRIFLQEKLDTIHVFFIEEVSRNRNMSYEDVSELADGRFFLGVEAYDVGLIDELGGEAAAHAHLQNVTGEKVVTKVLEDMPSLLEGLLGVRQRPPSLLQYLDAPGLVPMLR